MRSTVRESAPLAPSQHRLLLLITALALAIRLLYLWGQARNNPLFLYPRVDAHWHQAWAEQIAAGQGMDPEPYYRAPLYYYLLGGLYWLTGPDVLWGRLLGCGIGTLTTYLTARLGCTLGGFRVGLVAGLLAALYWPGIYFDGELLTASLECLLAVALVLLLLRAGRSAGIIGFFGAGLIWGLACITRPNFLALAPCILVWLFLFVPVVVSTGQKWARTGALLSGLALMILPVTARNLAVSGEPILITYTGGVNFYIGNNPDSTGISAVIPGTRRSLEGGFRDARRIPESELGRELSAQELSDYWWDRGLEWIQKDPAGWVGHTVYKSRLFFSPIELPNNQPIGFFASLSEISSLFWVGFPLIGALALASLCVLGSRWREWFLPWGFAVTYAGTVILFFVNARYRLPIYPILIVSASAGMVEVARSVNARSGRTLIGYGLALGLAAIFIATNPPPEREAFQQADRGEGYGILGSHSAGLGATTPEKQEQALRYFQEAVRLKPDSPQLQLALARQLQAMQRPGESERVLSRAARSFADSAEVHFEYGRFLAQSERNREAVQELQNAVRLQPAYAEAHQALGCRLAAMSRFAKAEPHLYRATQLDSNLHTSSLCLATIRLQQGRLPEAKALYLKVTEEEPENSQALLGLGDTAMLTENTSEAISYYRAALGMNPALPSASQNLAAALWSHGAYDESLSVLNRGLASSPEDRGLQIELAWRLATASEPRLRNGTQALRLAEAAGMHRPSLETYDTLAAALAELGRFEEARQALESGLALPQARLNTGRASAMQERLSLYQAGRPFRQ